MEGIEGIVQAVPARIHPDDEEIRATANSRSPTSSLPNSAKPRGQHGHQSSTIAHKQHHLTTIDGKLTIDSPFELLDDEADSSRNLKFEAQRRSEVHVAPVLAADHLRQASSTT